MAQERKSTLDKIYSKGDALLPDTKWDRKERVSLITCTQKEKKLCRKTNEVGKKEHA